MNMLRTKYGIMNAERPFEAKSTNSLSQYVKIQDFRNNKNYLLYCRDKMSSYCIK